MEYHLRRAETKDLGTLVEFQLAMAKETENLQLEKKTLEEGVQKILDDRDFLVGEYLIAQDSTTHDILGSLLLLKEWSDWRNGNVLWIHSVYIVPHARKLGIYKKMYLSLKDRVMNDSTLRGLRLYVDKTNTKAQNVYQKLGMTNEHYDLYEWMKDF